MSLITSKCVCRFLGSQPKNFTPPEQCGYVGNTTALSIGGSDRSTRFPLPNDHPTTGSKRIHPMNDPTSEIDSTPLQSWLKPERSTAYLESWYN
jgi:hypothetical protein